MAVPRASALRAGVAVNIVLKRDQPTGKLTQGYVGQLLTRGDHPRGVKVRLQDGQIGRVQSLLPPSWAPGQQLEKSPALARPVSDPTNESLAATDPQSMQQQPPDPAGRRPRRFRLQDDYRNDPVPAQNRSLEDYVTFKAPRKSQRKGKSNPTSSMAETSVEDDEDSSPQKVLEREFQNIDSALVAAILSDSANVEQARQTLQSLS